MLLLENQRIAARLEEAARLLAAQAASPYRVSAYRHAAQGIAHHPQDVRRIFEASGVKGLDAIPRVGLGIASAVAEMLLTGRWGMLERLRGESDPASLLQSVPGVGPALAARIHDQLHIDSLEDLEAAANDGRLEQMRGVGPRRLAALRPALNEMLGRLRRPDIAPHERPEVGTLLQLDREYRAGAAAGTLRRIAPRRLNPDHDAWLPVLHARRDPWHFTVLFSNTALAHRLGQVRDWVIVYAYDGDHVERQWTVVTERRGPLAGRRVVRGREAECMAHYEKRTQSHELRSDHAA
ncbi:MAG TPA: helix-hairpin-helix domain-containing protein [Usitatibacter sp.]|nr:helix-hairpin-helix domain-containing protein [Usitatibacter sp.]